MSNDKNTVGVTKENAGRLTSLVSDGHFNTELDAAKFAMATAINSGKSGGSVVKTDTKWNTGSIDKDGSLRILLELLFPDKQEPYRLLEQLINEGLEILYSDATDPDVHSLLFGTGKSQ